MVFDATSLYPSAMYDEKPVYLKIGTEFAFKPHMNNVHVKTFNNQTFNQDGNESAIVKLKYYNPPILIFQHLPFKEKVKNIELNRMRNGYIVDTLTSVDIQERIKIGDKVIQTHEGVFYRENIKKSYRKIVCFKTKIQRRTYRFDARFSKINHEQSLWISITPKH